MCTVKKSYYKRSCKKSKRLCKKSKTTWWLMKSSRFNRQNPRKNSIVWSSFRQTCNIWQTKPANKSSKKVIFRSMSTSKYSSSETCLCLRHLHGPMYLHKTVLCFWTVTVKSVRSIFVPSLKWILRLISGFAWGISFKCLKKTKFMKKGKTSLNKTVKKVNFC